MCPFHVNRQFIKLFLHSPLYLSKTDITGHDLVYLILRDTEQKKEAMNNTAITTATTINNDNNSDKKFDKWNIFRKMVLHMGKSHSWTKMGPSPLLLWEVRHCTSIINTWWIKTHTAVLPSGLPKFTFPTIIAPIDEFSILGEACWRSWMSGPWRGVSESGLMMLHPMIIKDVMRGLQPPHLCKKDPYLTPSLPLLSDNRGINCIILREMQRCNVLFYYYRKKLWGCFVFLCCRQYFIDVIVSFFYCTYSVFCVHSSAALFYIVPYFFFLLLNLRAPALRIPVHAHCLCMYT